MTLQELFDLLAANPVVLLFYFIALPLTAQLAVVLDRGEHYRVPWKYLYSFLVYAAAIPGIFALTLSIYLFLFEGRSILQTDIYTQILPIASGILTLLIIRRQVDLDLIPGFDRLSGLLSILLCVMAVGWILDRTSILFITLIPFYWVFLIIILFVVLFIFGWRRLKR